MAQYEDSEKHHAMRFARRRTLRNWSETLVLVSKMESEIMQVGLETAPRDNQIFMATCEIVDVFPSQPFRIVVVDPSSYSSTLPKQ